MKIKQKNYDLHSLRCDLGYKLDIAREFQHDVGVNTEDDAQTIYFPMNLDFRGRVYPIPPHLNHLGNDLCRGLLSFARRKPLGERGLFWLKIQVANLFGNDKVRLRVACERDLLRRPLQVGRREPREHPRVGPRSAGAGRVVEAGR